MSRGRISDASLTAVREAARIDQVVSQYVTLKRAGADTLKGLCPFHDEKSPSFGVNPSRSVFHCFGCQMGGDVLTFVQEIEGLSFIEAVERLADAFRVDLVYEGGGTDPAPAANRHQRARLVHANTAAATYYAEQLLTPEATPARTFLTERGFDRDAAASFDCGYAPKAWDTLAKHLRAAGFTHDELKAAGLVADGKNGPIDKFRGRLMFPIRDQSGDIIGFGARKIHPDDDGPKYLNTQETTIYKKSRVLYGLAQARKDISRTRRVVVVEGYTDVMACRLAGETTAVATCGTAFGEEHIRIIRRLLGDDASGGEVIYTFDGDSAGQKAALRAFSLDSHFQTHTSVAVDPDGLDPCEVRLRHGDAGVVALVENRTPLFEFALRATLSEHNLATPEGRANALTATAPMLAGIKHEQMRDEYVRRLAGWLSTSPQSLTQAVLRATTTSSGTPTPPARTASPGTPGAPGGAARVGSPDGSTTSGDPNDPNDPNAQGTMTEPGTPADPFTPVDPATLPVERLALKVLTQHHRFVDLALAEIVDPDFAHPTYRAVWRTITATYADPTAHARWTDALRANAPSPTIGALITELTVEAIATNTDGAVTQTFATSTFVRVALHGCEHRHDRMQEMLAHPELDPADLDRIIDALPRLQTRRDDASARLNLLAQ